MIDYFFFHLSKMRLTIGNEVLNTDTMTVTTTDEPNRNLIPSISLTNARIYPKSPRLNSQGTTPNDLMITFKNGNDRLQTYAYTQGGVTFRDKRLSPGTTIDFIIGTKIKEERMWDSVNGFLVTYFDDDTALEFQVKYYMPVILQLYYNFQFTTYLDNNPRIELNIENIESKLFKDMNIPEPLLEELRGENKRIAFLFSSFQPNFKGFYKTEKVYEVKSTEKNPCNFYHNFLAFANFRHSIIQNESLEQKGSTSLNQKSESPPDLTKFYIFFKEPIF